MSGLLVLQVSINPSRERTFGVPLDGVFQLIVLYNPTKHLFLTELAAPGGTFRTTSTWHAARGSVVAPPEQKGWTAAACTAMILGRGWPVLFTKTFPEESYRRALGDWEWLPLEGKYPFLASLFGDVFLEDCAGIWMLDVLEGRLTCVFPDRQQMAAALDTQEGQDRYLMAGLALGADRRLGLVPGPDQVLAWTLPPVLGAPIKVENLQLMGFVPYLSSQGQLHRQLRERPPGAKITGFTFIPARQPDAG